MTTIIDERTIHAPLQLCYRIAADVERWSVILPHYSFVRFREKKAVGTGIVEMSAYRDFVGPLRYRTWWLSDMHVDPVEPAVHYVHIGGFTKGMIVKWSFEETPNGTHVSISHAWNGPAWPVIGPIAWKYFISKQFVSFIATRTLAGVALEAERRAGIERQSA